MFMQPWQIFAVKREVKNCSHPMEIKVENMGTTFNGGLADVYKCLCCGQLNAYAKVEKMAEDEEDDFEDEEDF